MSAVSSWDASRTCLSRLRYCGAVDGWYDGDACARILMISSWQDLAALGREIVARPAICGRNETTGSYSGTQSSHAHGLYFTLAVYFLCFFFFFFYINQSQALTRALTQRCGSRRGSLAWNTHHTGQGQRQSEREKERQRVKVLECRTGRTIAVLTSIRFI